MAELILFYNSRPPPDIYTLSLHDALPIFGAPDRQPADLRVGRAMHVGAQDACQHLTSEAEAEDGEDRKSTRLNSSHTVISYAVFCLKKKKFGLDIACGKRRWGEATVNGNQ